MFEIDRNKVRGGKTVYGAAVGILVWLGLLGLALYLIFG